MIQADFGIDLNQSLFRESVYGATLKGYEVLSLFSEGALLYAR